MQASRASKLPNFVSLLLLPNLMLRLLFILEITLACIPPLHVLGLLEGITARIGQRDTTAASSLPRMELMRRLIASLECEVTVHAACRKIGQRTSKSSLRIAPTL